MSHSAENDAGACGPCRRGQHAYCDYDRGPLLSCACQGCPIRPEVPMPDVEKDARPRCPGCGSSACQSPRLECERPAIWCQKCAHGYPCTHNVAVARTSVLPPTKP